MQLQTDWRASRLPGLIFPADEWVVCLIGRGTDCDLILQDPTVSRHHAELRHVGDEWVLVDLGSTNGTFVNGWRVGSRRAVRAGDCVAFGLAGFRLVDHVARFHRRALQL